MIRLHVAIAVAVLSLLPFARAADEGVVAGAAAQRVAVEPAVEGVAAGAAVELVPAAAAAQEVVAGLAVELVVTVAAVEPVVAGAAVEVVVAERAENEVVAGVAVDVVVAAAGVDAVVARAAAQRVVAGEAVHQVGGRSPVEDVARVRSVDRRHAGFPSSSGAHRAPLAAHFCNIRADAVLTPGVRQPSGKRNGGDREEDGEAGGPVLDREAAAGGLGDVARDLLDRVVDDLVEPAQAGRIRLTSQGVEARETLKNPGDGIAIESVLGFVFKDSLFFRDFYIQHYGPSGRRPPVFGEGKILRVEKLNLERPQQVVIHGAERVEIHDPKSKPLRVTKSGVRRPPSGRPAENAELVSFALALQDEGKTWKEIARKWNEAHPDKWRSENAIRMAVKRNQR